MSLQLPYSDQPNLAPAKPLAQNMQERAQDKSIEIDPDEWFTQQKEKLEGEEKPAWEAEVLKWALLFLFIEGNMLIKKSKYGKGWRTPAAPERTDLPIYGFNYAGFYSEALRAAWTASNTDINWRPMRDDDNAQGAAKGAENVAGWLGRKLGTNEFKQTEALLGQCGKYARYSYYTSKQKSHARRIKTEEQSIQLGESSFLCPDCGAGGVLPDAGGVQPAEAADPLAALQGQQPSQGVQPAQEGGIDGQPKAGYDPLIMGDAQAGDGLPGDIGAQGAPDPGAMWDGGESSVPGYSSGSSTCPACGSPNAELTPAANFPVEVPTGYEYFETGSIVRESVPAFELKHDTTKSPQDSDYLIRSRRIRVDALQYEFQDLQISKANGDDLGLKMEDALKRSAITSGRRSFDNNDTETADFIQIWMKPCLYGNKRLKDDLVTRAGETIPAGTVLGERFPKGLYMAFIQGVKGVVELRDECHKDFWVGGVLRQRAISSFGSGLEGLVNANMQLNLINSIIFEQLRTSAMPATLVDARLLPNGLASYIGSLSNVPVDLTALDDKLRLSDAVHQLQPQPPTQSHFAYGEKLNAFMQLDSRVLQFSGALPNVDNKTATGAEIGQASSQQMLGPQLANKADVDRRTAEIELQIFKDNCFDEVYVSLQGRRGEQDGIWLSNAAINVDMYAEVVPDSYLPQTNLERRERWDAFLQRVGGLPGLKLALQESPAQVEQIAEIFDVDLAGEDYSSSAEICRERIDQMAAAIPMLQLAQQQMPQVQMAADPMSGQMIAQPVDPMAEAGQFLLSILQPPPMIEELGHLGSIHYLRSWLTTDEGKKAPPELRQGGVKALLYFHLEGLMAEAQFTGMLGMMGQPPGPAGQESEKSKGGGGPRDAKQQMGAAAPEKQQPAMAAM